MSKITKKPNSPKAAGKPNQGGAVKQKSKQSFAKKNGVHKPNIDAKKAMNQKNQRNQNQFKKQQHKPAKTVVEAESDSDSEEEVKEGIQMFKGLPKDKKQQKNKKAEESLEKSLNSSEATDEEDESDSDMDSNDEMGLKMDEDSDENDDSNEDSDDDDDEDEEKEIKQKGNKKDKALQLQDLLGESLADDDEDDEFEAKEDEEDDDDDLDTDDEDDEDDEPSPKKSKLEMKDPPRKSLVNDESDTEFTLDGVEEEDSDDETTDIPKKTSKKEKKENPVLTPEQLKVRLERTIFVGNIPKDCTPKKITKLFKKYGSVESVRMRNIIPSDPKMSKKVAYITKQVHPKTINISAFVVFVTKESAHKALAMNGQKLDNNILIVNIADRSQQTFDSKKAVFMGNLPYEVNMNDIYELFSKCGGIDSVRIIRDKKTGLSKGFGYVNFTSTDSVTLALELNGSKVGEREIRVKTCNAEGSKKRKRNDSTHQNKKPKNKNAGGVKKPNTNEEEKQGDVISKKNKKKNKKSQGQQNEQWSLENATKKQNKNEGSLKKPQIKNEASPKKPQNQPTFEGQKADLKKKKNKPNKEAQQKAVMAKKLTAKSAKAQ